jgi:hypothetical protein
MLTMKIYQVRVLLHHALQGGGELLIVQHGRDFQSHQIAPQVGKFRELLGIIGLEERKAAA